MGLIAIWIVLLSTPFGSLPPLGNFLSPGIGFWANAPVYSSPPKSFKPLNHDSVISRVKIILDNRLVPHIKADNDYDLYYAQGYVQAYYRLWQMDMQVRAAAGMLSEVAGESALQYDRGQRRKGMIWAAEKTLKEMEDNPKTKNILTAYTNGVNAYIHSLNYKHLPLEYKLMNFSPEDWQPLKCALLLKYMADILTGYSKDIGLSYARQSIPPKEFNFLFPNKLNNSIPVIPRGTKFMSASEKKPKIQGDSLFESLPIVTNTKIATVRKNYLSTGLGSNNWALDNTKTDSGFAILCNDPHLKLNLPSIWFETQLTSPDLNCYGVSIPGTPGIIIGFNDSISWGLTNNYRDVKDYYALKIDDSAQHYHFDGQWIPFENRIEKIKVKGAIKPVLDTVKYAIQGPVEYEPSFPDPAHSGTTLAMQWMAHKSSNELLAIYLLNRAGDYASFVNAIQHFHCPAQNFIYADVKGNIAIWGQGLFINKWKNQGRFVMRGDTSATLWGETIPTAENPHVLNPPQHYLESANQQVTDNTYPYYYNGDFDEFRSWEINHFLNKKKKFSIQDMMALQNNNWSIIADKLMPIFKNYGGKFGKDFPVYFTNWNDSLSPKSHTGAAFQIWWHYLYINLWTPLFKQVPLAAFPSEEKTIQLILEDTSKLSKITRQPFSKVVDKSFKETKDSLKSLKRQGKNEWYQIKNTSVIHLAKIKPFSFYELPTGGSGTTINSMHDNHGPSWRMIVEMKPGDVQAWCTYPGGQSGNPGSLYYNSFLDYWVKGKYYKIHFFHAKDYESNSKAEGKEKQSDQPASGK